MGLDVTMEGRGSLPESTNRVADVNRASCCSLGPYACKTCCTRDSGHRDATPCTEYSRLLRKVNAAQRMTFDEPEFR